MFVQSAQSQDRFAKTTFDGRYITNSIDFQDCFVYHINNKISSRIIVDNDKMKYFFFPHINNIMSSRLIVNNHEMKNL